MRVLIAADHAGIALKASIIAAYPSVQWEDLGPTAGQRVDYPDYAEKLAKRLLGESAALGVLICGSGIGMSIAANKIAGIRAALCENPVSSRLAREHNAANVLCLGARFLAPEYAVEILDAWLKANPSNEGRHQERIKKIHQLESSS